MLRAGYWILLVYLLGCWGRFFDNIQFASDQWLPITGIAGVLSVAGLGAVLLSGRFTEVALSRIGILYLAMTFWFCLTAPFSVWPSGSLRVLYNDWAPSITLLILLVAFGGSAERLRRILLFSIFGLFVTAGRSLYQGLETADERLEGADIAFGNSNDLALVMLMALPLAVYLARERAHPGYARALGFAALAPMFVVIVRTGSRAALVSLAVTGVYVFFRLSGGARVALTVAMALAAALSLAFIPKETIARYETLLESGPSDDPLNEPLDMDRETAPDVERVMRSAQESASIRKELLFRSLRMTAEHPLLGSGVGMFEVAENDLALEEGRRRGYWKVTHNAYTQVSSETGIPGVVFFWWILYLAWKMLARLEQFRTAEAAEVRSLGRLAFHLKIALLSVLVCAATLSVAYKSYIPFLVGLTLATESAMRAEVRRRVDWTAGRQGADRAVAPSPWLKPQPVGYRRA